MHAIFVAALVLQMTFQTFATWYALHGTERFGVRPEDVTIGFMCFDPGAGPGQPIRYPSCRSATAGSTEAARHAGSAHASTTAAPIIPAATR